MLHQDLIGERTELEQQKVLFIPAYLLLSARKVWNRLVPDGGCYTRCEENFLIRVAPSAFGGRFTESSAASGLPTVELRPLSAGEQLAADLKLSNQYSKVTEKRNSRGGT